MGSGGREWSDLGIHWLGVLSFSCRHIGLHPIPSHSLLEDCEKERAREVRVLWLSLVLGTYTKALLFEVSDGTLLHCIKSIAHSAFANGGIGELVPHVVVDLLHGGSPLEIDIDLLGGGTEDFVNYLIAKEWLWAVHGGGA